MTTATTASTKALADCVKTAQDPEESQDYARGVRAVLSALAGDAYEAGNWELANKLLEFRDMARCPAELMKSDQDEIADRLVREDGTVMAEWILQKAMMKVCGVETDCIAISQIWVIKDKLPGERLNTSALAAEAAKVRGR